MAAFQDHCLRPGNPDAVFLGDLRNLICMEHWNGLPTEAVDSSLEICKTRLDEVLCNLP